MMKAIRCIVFSRDRAMQLDAFLTSARKYVPHPGYQPVVVVYRASSPAFAAAYDLLRAEHPTVEWCEEQSFREDLLRTLGPEELTVFHTDDDVFFDTVPAFELRDDEVCFALRLGLNVTYCYPLDAADRLSQPQFEGDRISWNWRSQQQGSFSYPLALNGHVFRSAEVRAWLRRVAYGNPNELEASLLALRDELRPRMASFRRSRVVNIPANLVNETFANRHGSDYEVDDLNERFLVGERIDVASMDFGNVLGCHQEVPFLFRRPIPRV
jgi:hypothetical protein